MTLCGSASVFYIHTENWVLYSFKYDTLWRYFTSFSLLSIFSCVFQFFSLSHNEKSFHSTTGYIHWNAFIYSTFKIVNTLILKCIALWQMYTHLTFVYHKNKTICIRNTLAFECSKMKWIFSFCVSAFALHTQNDKYTYQ